MFISINEIKSCFSFTARLETQSQAWNKLKELSKRGQQGITLQELLSLFPLAQIQKSSTVKKIFKLVFSKSKRTLLGDFATIDEASLLNLGTTLYSRIIKIELIDHILNFLSSIPSVDMNMISSFDTLYQISQIENHCEASLEVTELVNTIIEYYRPLLPFVIVKGCDYDKPWGNYQNAFHHFVTNPTFLAKLEYALLFSKTNCNIVGKFANGSVLHCIAKEEHMPLNEKIRWLQSFLTQGSKFDLQRVNQENKTVYDLMCHNHPEDIAKFSFIQPDKQSALGQKSIFSLSIIRVELGSTRSENLTLLEEDELYKL